MTDHEGRMECVANETWHRVVGELDPGAPQMPVVICHGGPGAAHDYCEPIADLSRFGRTCVLYDQLGCGKSELLPDAPADFWTPRLFKDELAELTRHLGIADRYAVVGGGVFGSLQSTRAKETEAARMPRMAGTATGSTAEERYTHLTTASRALWERALGSLPGGNTRTTIFHDPYPVYLGRGEGCRVTDVDGVERIDFINNYTSLVHGHCHPRVVEAVQRQAAQLMSAAAPNELEVEMAERIRERLPSIELIRYANSGTEATMLAIRAARGFTGRTTIATFAGAYHGTHDYAASIPASAGGAQGGLGIPRAVADSILVAPFNDSETTRAVLEPHFDDLAAVIVEPVMGAGGVIPAQEHFLSFLRELADEAGALLVFDEVIAFRIGYHGAQGWYGVTPDLTTLGKIIGGGLPVGALGGRADVMALFDPRDERRLGHGGTFNANPLSMAAGLATLAELTPEALERLETLAVELKTKLDQLFADVGLPACITQIGSLFNVHLTEGPVLDHSDVLAADTALLRELHLAMLGNGILFTARGMGCLSTPMSGADVDAFVEAARLGLRQLGVA